MARTIPRAAVDEFTRQLNLVSESMRGKLAEQLAQIDFSAPGAIDVVKDLMQTYCGAATDASALLAAQFYDESRTYVIGEPLGAVAESGRAPIATSIAVDGIFNQAKTTEGLVSELTSRLDYETKRGAANSTIANGMRDPKKPRFARVPTGNDTCMFCIMLASRGYVYHSEKSAGALDHWHANCRCRVVSSWDSPVEGYDPDYYLYLYEHPEEVERLKEQRQEQQKERSFEKVELKDISIDHFPAQFSNTKGKKQSFEAFVNAVNAVDGADPKLRDIYSNIDAFSNSENMPVGEFDVKYGAGKGCVSTYTHSVTKKVTKLTVELPKMTSDNIGGTVYTTCHELGHYIDLLSGSDGKNWLSSSKYAGFLRTKSKSAIPNGRILEEMRLADDRYSVAMKKLNDWYMVESKRISAEYENASGDYLSRAQAIKKMTEDRKALRKEFEKRADIDARTAMNGVSMLQDIYDALNEGHLRGQIIDGVNMRYGHGEKYYRSVANQVEEIWANYCSLSLTRPELIELLREDQPALVESMDAMRDEIFGRLHE